MVDNILKDRYYQPGESSWFDIAKRVSDFIGEEFYDLIATKTFIPNSPCLMNAGTDNPQCSACFTIPIPDSIEGIFDAVKNAAIIHKSGGGTGFDFSDIRAKDSTVGSTGGVASGPVSFISVFNSATETIKQGSKRRGANLASLDVTHPDVMEFITCKKKEGNLSNFNISVNLPDSFMKNPDKKIWNAIIEGMWRNGEPGLIFPDRAEYDNTCKHLGKVKYRNPCQEFVGLAWESCILGSINLLNTIRHNHFSPETFEHIVRKGVQFLDTVIDKNEYPLSEIDVATKKTRKIGLGVMGFADLLIALGMRYNSEEAYEFADKVFGLMRTVADDESRMIAVRKGTYPESRGDPRRNASVLSIAPTGTISLFAEVSSGIEPNFGYVYTRSTWSSGEKKTYEQVHPLFAKHVKENYFDQDGKHLIAWMKQHNSIQDCPYALDETKKLFVTAKDIAPLEHVRMQAVVQKHVDQSISKTINCSHETTREEIEEVVREAWKSGCKGLTIYRDGSRNDVVLAVDKKEARKNGTAKRKKELTGKTMQYSSGCGTLYITVNFDESGKIIEVLANPNGGGCNASIEAMCRLASVALRNNHPITDIIRQLRKVNPCVAAGKNKQAEGKSCADIIGRCLAEHLKDQGKPEVNKSGPVCPDCGAPVAYADGCRRCTECSWSKCG